MKCKGIIILVIFLVSLLFPLTQALIPSYVTITGASQIILGDSMNYFADSSGGLLIYQWYANGSLVGNVTSQYFTFKPTNWGTYQLNVVVQEYYTTTPTVTSNTLLVTVSPPPIQITLTNSTNLRIQGGQEIHFSASATGGTGLYNFQWGESYAGEGYPVTTTKVDNDTTSSFYSFIGNTALSEATYSVHLTVQDSNYPTNYATTESWIFVYNLSPTATPTQSAVTTNLTTPTQQPTDSTVNPSPTPAIPEFSLLVTVLTLVVITMVVVMARKTNLTSLKKFIKASDNE